MPVEPGEGTGPALQIAEGWTCELPEEAHRILDARTDPTWPTTWFAPRLTGEGAFADVYSVMSNWGANHGVLSYGHVGADMIALAAMLRIPVCMHNVPEEKLFRPAPGTPLARRTVKARISGPARRWGRFTGENKRRVFAGSGRYARFPLIIRWHPPVMGRNVGAAPFVQALVRC